jgi:hypothetical protein
MYRTEILEKRSIYDDKMHNSLVTVIVLKKTSDKQTCAPERLDHGHFRIPPRKPGAAKPGKITVT